MNLSKCCNAEIKKCQCSESCRVEYCPECLYTTNVEHHEVSVHPTPSTRKCEWADIEYPVCQCEECKQYRPPAGETTTPTSTAIDIETVGKVAFNELLHGKKRSIDLSDHEYACMKAYMAEHDIEWDKIENLSELQSPPTSTVEEIINGYVDKLQQNWNAECHHVLIGSLENNNKAALAEATQAITRLIQQAELRGRIDERKTTVAKWLMPLSVGTNYDGSLVSGQAIRWYNGIMECRRNLINKEIAELQAQLTALTDKEGK